MAVYSARQSSYSDGDTITSAHTNDEFNAILAVFNVIAISVFALVPNTSALLNRLDIGPPSPALLPSCVCPVDTLNAANIVLNSSLLCAALIVSPLEYELCRAE